METAIGILFILLIITLIKPNAAIFDKVPFFKNKGNGIRRLYFFGFWFILSSVLVIMFGEREPQKATDRQQTDEAPQKDFAILDDSTTVVLKGKDTLRFDTKGNIEWTATGMNDGSSARINVVFTEPVGVYSTSTHFDRKNFDGLVYSGFKFYEGEYGVVGLYNFKGDNGLVRIGKATDRSNVITQKEYQHLQSAIELKFKTQIKPLEYYDIKSFVDSIKIYIQNVDGENSQYEKREYVISNDDDVFKVILNGIFPNND